MEFSLDCVEDKEKFHIEKCKEYGNQRVNERETLLEQVNIWEARPGGILCYQNEKTRLFHYSDTKIKNMAVSLIHFEIETENKIYTFTRSDKNK